MRIAGWQLRELIREAMDDEIAALKDEFRAALAARKKYYNDLAKKPLPYDVGEIITVGEPRTRTAWRIPVIIEPGTRLEVNPGVIIRIQGAQIRNTQMDMPDVWALIREPAVEIPWREQVFGDARGTWRVGDLFDYASNRYDLQQILVSDLEENNLNDFDQTTSDESEEDYVSRAMSSNLDYPIIVVNYPDGPWIADGTHRAWKARELGVPYLMGWILDWEEILDVTHRDPMPESFSSPY